MERITRALLYTENSIEFTVGQVEWKIGQSPDDYSSIPEELKLYLTNQEPKTIGDNVFTYLGFCYPGKPSSLWIMRFYGGMELMSFFRDEYTLRKHRITRS
jgi:hypothetical protein